MTTVTKTEEVTVEEVDPGGERAADTIGNTRAWARAAHGKQTDKNGLPYVTHLDAVARNLYGIVGFDTELLKACYLHDTLEDTAITGANLEEEGYSDRTIHAVYVVTKGKGEANWDYTTRVIKGGTDSMLVKLADLYHNSDPNRIAQQPVATQERLEEKYFSAIFRIEHALVKVGFFGQSDCTITFEEAYDAVKPVTYSNSSWATRHPVSLMIGDLVRFKADKEKVFTIAKKRVSKNGKHVFQFEEMLHTDVVLDYDSGKGNYESKWKSSALASTAGPVHFQWQKRLGLPAGFKHGDPLPDTLEGEKA